MEVRIVSEEKLREFWERHADAKGPLSAWYHEARRSDWNNPVKVKETYGSAKFVGQNRIVFKIKGNRYRIVTRIDFSARTVCLLFLGTHSEYERIDVREV